MATISSFALDVTYAVRYRDYDKQYFIPQLRDLIKERLELDTPKNKRKSYYINILLKADVTPTPQAMASVVYPEAAPETPSDPPFRFLDLYPELRNRVYEELLTLKPNAPKGKRGCCPAILGTNRLICTEAEGILYSNSYDVNFRFKRRLGYRDTSSDFQFADCLSTRWFVDVSGSRLLKSQYQWWPKEFPSLLKFQNLKVTLTFDLHRLGSTTSLQPVTAATIKDKEKMCIECNNTLFMFITFLGKSKHLKHLQLDINVLDSIDTFDRQPDMFRKALWPLSQIQHFVKPACVEYIGPAHHSPLLQEVLAGPALPIYSRFAHMTLAKELEFEEMQLIRFQRARWQARPKPDEVTEPLRACTKAMFRFLYSSQYCDPEYSGRLHELGATARKFLENEEAKRIMDEGDLWVDPNEHWFQTGI